MLKINLIKDNSGKIDHIETNLMGGDLLSNSKLNKGCAFTQEERARFHLHGLLPPLVETLDQQVARMYMQYSEHHSNLSKNIYLNVLHDYNETLFYTLVSQLRTS
jgi:malate dehydrogenase (oxaloacetate-decarboxylating)